MGQPPVAPSPGRLNVYLIPLSPAECVRSYGASGIPVGLQRDGNNKKSNPLTLIITIMIYIINEALKIRINNEDIVKVSETKFLGIYIDFRLNWKKHIQNISNKVSKCIAIIYCASRVLNETALIMLYNTLVLPYLTYCSEVWGRAYRNNLYPLNIKQKQIVRIIAKIGRYDHTSPFSLNSRF